MTTGVDIRRSRHVVCVVGAKLDLDRVGEVVGQVGGDGFAVDLEYSLAEPDPRIPALFEASSDPLEPSFTEADLAAVAEHRGVAYVVGPPAGVDDAYDVSRRMLALVAALLESGADAARSASSGLAHGRDRWLALAGTSATGADRAAQAPALCAAFVHRPLSSGLVYFSRGLHLLGECDVEVTVADDDRGVDWMDGLAHYLVVDRGESRIRDGDTFGLQAEGARRVLRHRPCTRYRETDLSYNPWGYWRLGP